MPHEVRDWPTCQQQDLPLAEYRKMIEGMYKPKDKGDK
jgi:hypothetical protein